MKRREKFMIELAWIAMNKDKQVLYLVVFNSIHLRSGGVSNKETSSNQIIKRKTLIKTLLKNLKISFLWKITKIKVPIKIRAAVQVELPKVEI